MRPASTFFIIQLLNSRASGRQAEPAGNRYGDHAVSSRAGRGRELAVCGICQDGADGVQGI